MIAERLRTALNPMCEELGLDLVAGGGSYDPTMGTFKPRVEFKLKEVGGVDRARAEFAHYCESFGLKPGHYSSHITLGKKIYSLVGFQVRKKHPVVMRDLGNGKTYVFDEAVLDQIPDRTGKSCDSICPWCEKPAGPMGANKHREICAKNPSSRWFQGGAR